MLTLANVLALALIADGPPPPPAPSPTPAAGVPFESNLPKISKPGNSVSPEPEEIWHLTLPEAIRIGLDNSEVVRVISLGGETVPPGEAGRSPIVIARLNADASLWNFKAAMLAHVRSVEQQYWALSICQVDLWAREAAVKLGEEILARARAGHEEGKATEKDLAEATQQLENFRLNLVSATSDVITTERQLRNILGLRPADGRRIVPATEPTEVKFEPEWETCLVQMRASQPEVARQDAQVRLTELQALGARARPSPAPRPEILAGQLGMPTGLGATAIDADQAEHQLARERELLQQVLRKATGDLARSALNVDSSFERFQAAGRLRLTAQKRLEIQRAFYEEGRLGIDRLLDAVSQHANAVSQEALFRSTYNTAIAALEEAKGTLLAHDGITVLDNPAPRKRPAGDDKVAPAVFEAPAAKAGAAGPAPASYKIRARIGGVPVLEVEVEVGKPGR